MARRYDAIVVGGGHNGLVCAAYLSRAGLSSLVLERREHVGGAAVTEEITPGARAPVLAHAVEGLRRSVVRDLRLGEHGLELVSPPVRLFAPQPDGRAVTLWADTTRTTDGLREWSPKDAEAYPGFDRKVRALGSFMAHLNVRTPPDIGSPSVRDAVSGLRLARALRGLGGPAQRREALRVLPMSVADLLEEEFDTDALRAAIAVRAVRFAAMGPRSGGTALKLLADSAGGGGAAGRVAFPRGGPGALVGALAAAARSFGTEIRTGAEVAAVRTERHRAIGVALASGEEIDAGVVVSGIDPKRMLRELVDPVEAGPTLRWRAGNLRMPGMTAKVNLVLNGLPRFTAAPDGSDVLEGRIVVAPGLEYLERAFDASKYGRISEQPFLEATIPTLTDPTMATAGRHVLSVLVQWAPYHRRDGSWEGDGDRLGALVLQILEEYAPGLSSRVAARQVITPLDLERDYGLTEGHPLHGEYALDQFFAWRPLYGHARYRLAVHGLYLCGSGAHPGGGITGAPGANAAREILIDLRGR